LDATKQDMVRKGQAVTVVLPDNSTVTGKVASIGSVATADNNNNDNGGGGDNPPTNDGTVSLGDPAASGELGAAPGPVTGVTSSAKNALAVPVDALLALSEGGYGVERRGAGGTSSLVAVKLGAFAGGWVQVTGNLAAGDEVEVPAT